MIPLDLINQGTSSDNWVKAYLHFEGQRGVYHNFKKKSNKKSDCYAVVAQAVGSCWLEYVIIHCVAQDVSITCSSGGGGSPGGSSGGSTPGGGPPPIDSGVNGGGSGNYVNWNGNSGSGGTIKVTDLDFNIEWEPSPEDFEDKLNCPRGEFHKIRTGIKASILKDMQTPYCSNPDIHLDDEDNIILACPSGGKEKVNTGVSIYVYACG